LNDPINLNDPSGLVEWGTLIESVAEGVTEGVIAAGAAALVIALVPLEVPAVIGVAVLAAGLEIGIIDAAKEGAVLWYDRCASEKDWTRLIGHTVGHLAGDYAGHEAGDAAGEWLKDWMAPGPTIYLGDGVLPRVGGPAAPSMPMSPPPDLAAKYPFGILGYGGTLTVSPQGNIVP
jgi:hypothetical protein